jgi:hypothetical protein
MRSSRPFTPAVTLAAEATNISLQLLQRILLPSRSSLTEIVVAHPGQETETAIEL